MNDIFGINAFLKGILDPDDMNDLASNGIQVGNDGLIDRISFAVDCSIDAIQKAVDNGSRLLIVHHGLFWGKPLPVTLNHRQRLKMFLENNMGLIAYHLPLDCHESYGNNVRILEKIGVEKKFPFGLYKGIKIGFIGETGSPVGIEHICRNLGITVNGETVRYLGFGKEMISKIAVVSGGGGSCFEEAVREKADIFITGDAEHELYHYAKENRINLLFAGHYFTETFGVKALCEIVRNEFNISTAFCEIPTGL